MKLSDYERKSLINFILLYVGSSVFLISVIAFLIYENEERNSLEMMQMKMEHFADMQGEEIIKSDMKKSKEYMLPEVSEYEVALYDKSQSLLDGDDLKGIDFAKKAYQKDGDWYYLSKAANGHLGVEHIVVKKRGYDVCVQDLRKDVILYWAIAVVFISLMAYWLGRIFLKPVREKIDTIDEFIKDSTHELSTPLTALMLSVDALSKQAPSKALTRIKLSSRQIADIYHDLTFLLQLDQTAKIDEEIDMKALLEERVNYFTPLAEHKRLEFILELHAFIFMMERTACIRLFDNIISNAIKYNMKDKKIYISIKGKNVLIRDEGKGMDKVEQKQVFERYMRVEKNRGGFGIGLDIVKQVTSRYDIKIEINSKPNIGTLFTLKFP
ncbi:HAMP domain-containing histidine kinase [Sulfurimonas sp. MAG313]|nr:HAMP domain-containing sensor histidine kinase [Sulfurimonas sp. MAG313]MDF1881337.1 HAMP domain-containing histidine kinase [Sulfurimonas sp. MAG313]